MTKKEKKLANSFQKILIISTILSVAIIFAFRMVWHYSFLKSGLSSTQNSIEKLYQKEVKNYSRYNTQFFDEFLHDIEIQINREIEMFGNTLHSAAISVYRDYNSSLPEHEVKTKIMNTLEQMRDLDIVSSVSIVDTSGTFLMTRGIDGLEGKNLSSYLSHSANRYMLNEFKQFSNTSVTTHKKDSLYLSRFWTVWLHNYRNNIVVSNDSSSVIVPPVVVTDDLKQVNPSYRNMIVEYYINRNELETVLCIQRFAPYQWGIVYEYKTSERWKQILESKRKDAYSLIQGLYEDVKTMSIFIDADTDNHIFLGKSDYWSEKKDLITYIKKSLIDDYKDGKEKEGFFPFRYPYGKLAKNYVCYYQLTENPSGISATIIEEGAKIVSADYLGAMYRKQAVVEVIIIIILLSILLGIVLFWTYQVRRRLEHYVEYICDAFNSYMPGVTPFEIGNIQYWEWQKVADAANRMMMERSRIENELNSERALTEQLFSRNINAVVLINPGGEIQKVNPSFQELFGFDCNEVVGKNIDDLIVPEGMINEATDFTNKAVTIDNISFEARRKHKNGKLLDVQVYTTPVIVNDYVVAIYSIYEDISLKKKAEQHIIKAKEEALAASKAKSSFLATVSHEIRTPLNGIIGMTEVMTNTALNKEQQDYLEIIHNSGDTLLVIINDILDLSKMESGDLDIVKKMFDLDKCLSSCLDVISAEADQKGIETLLVMDSSVPRMISTDEFRLRQVMLNFVSNAVKFTEKGEVKLIVSVVEESEESINLRFEVSDTGIGIPEDKLESIFDTFTQADSTITRRFGGTGLGLAISKKIVRILGSDVHVQSKEGSGTSFIFNLNIEEWERTTTVFDTSRILKGKKALLVDSNRQSQRVIKSYLESYALQPFIANDLISALAILNDDNEFEFCLINNNSNKKNILEFAKNVRKSYSADDLKLILLKSPGSTYKSLSDFQAVLRKPVSLYKLAPAFSEDNREKREEKTLISRELYKGFSEEFSLKILLAEDNIVNQKLAYHLLGKLGYSIDIVDNGKKALEHCLKEKYDVVLMDLQMPIMDGITASKEIIARLDGQERPYIIALTANSAELNRQECLEVGMDDFISKPFKARELKERFVKVYNDKYM